MDEMAKVYAVEMLPGRFIPRSQAALTKREPKLWVKRSDAERAASRHRYGRSDTFEPRIVEFRLVEEATDGE